MVVTFVCDCDSLEFPIQRLARVKRSFFKPIRLEGEVDS
jgi:hypothetical protein